MPDGSCLVNGRFWGAESILVHGLMNCFGAASGAHELVWCVLPVLREAEQAWVGMQTGREKPAVMNLARLNGVGTA